MTDGDDIVIGTLSVSSRQNYAERSYSWKAGMKSEDELLQRIWNLAGDNLVMIDAFLEAVTQRDRLKQQLQDEIEMTEQSLDSIRDLAVNWRRMVDEHTYDGECIIDELLRSLIEDMSPEMMKVTLKEVS